MRLVEAGLIVLGVICAGLILWMLAYLIWDTERDQISEVKVSRGRDREVTHLDALRWKGWTPSSGWPPETCWRGCKGFHRHDWWKAYQGRTCWDGCADLHRDDWWRAYVDQADRAESNQAGAGRGGR